MPSASPTPTMPQQLLALALARARVTVPMGLPPVRMGTPRRLLLYRYWFLRQLAACCCCWFWHTTQPLTPCWLVPLVSCVSASRCLLSPTLVLLQQVTTVALVLSPAATLARYQRQGATRLRATWELSLRTFLNVLRNPFLLMLNYVATAVVAILAGLVFHHLPFVRVLCVASCDSVLYSHVLSCALLPTEL